jgi:hypothetical protein
MEEVKPKLLWFDCCACCTRCIPVGAGLKVGGRIFCSEEHAFINARYLRLCKKAVEKAKRYDRPDKKGEVDYRVADFYLRTKLGTLVFNTPA